jgi:hypothetical protein
MNVSKLSESRIANLSQIDEDAFEDMIMEINLKRPKVAYDFFILEMKQIIKDSDPNFPFFKRDYTEKWKTLPLNEKQKYVEMAQHDKLRYKDHMALVKKYIIEKPLNQGVLSRTIYVDECVKEAIENDRNPKEAKIEARQKWSDLPENVKKEYHLKREKHRELYQALMNSQTRISGYTLFTKDQLMQAKEKNKQNMSLTECSELWKKVEPAIREKYKSYAAEVMEEREKLKDLYEITFGIKPSKPLRPINFLVMEMAHEGKLKGKTPFKEAASLWRQLTDEEKERYFKIAQKSKLAYTIKKLEYLAGLKRSIGKPRTAKNLFYSDLIKNDKVIKDLPFEKNYEYCNEKWINLDDETKKKYFDLASEEIEKWQEKVQSKICEEPKKPRPPYQSYFSNHFHAIKNTKPEWTFPQIVKEIGERWRKLTEKDKKSRMEIYQKELEEYRKKLKEFHENSSNTGASKTPSTVNEKKVSNKRRTVPKDDNEEDEIENDRSRSKRPKKSEKKSA